MTPRPIHAADRAVLALTLLVGGVILACLKPSFASLGNLTNVVNQAAIVAITGAGMTLAIAAGVFDLSVGSILALASCLGASLANRGSVAGAAIVCLAAAAGMGAVNGLIVTKARVPAFIATLGMMIVLRGLVLLYTDGRDITIAPAMIDRFGWIGGGRIAGVPVPVVLLGLVYGAFYIVLWHTPFGRHLCALGSARDAALSSGLPVDRIAIVVFALVGCTAGLSGLVLTAQIKGVSGSTAGLTFELQAIAVAVLGGTSLRGGRACLGGTLLGALLVATANNALNLYNTAPHYQRLVMGLILLTAVAVDGLRRGRRQPTDVDL